jgi:hypothetical protein
MRGIGRWRELLAVDIRFQVFGADAQSISEPDACQVAAPENLIDIRATYVQDLGDFKRIQ